MRINFVRTNDLAKIPTKGSKGAAGHDLYAATSYNVIIPPHKTVVFDTGLIIEIPQGFWGGVFARSGISTRDGLRPATCVSVIDEDFRGVLLVPIHNDTDNEQTIPAGSRIAQFILMPKFDADFCITDKVSDTERGEGGFGSTGIK